MIFMIRSGQFFSDGSSHLPLSLNPTVELFPMQGYGLQGPFFETS